MVKWAIIVLLSAALLFGAYLYGFQRGKLKTEIKIVEKIVEVNREAKRGFDAVQKQEQCLTDPELDYALCNELNIVRRGEKCDKLPDMD